MLLITGITTGIFAFLTHKMIRVNSLKYSPLYDMVVGM